MERSERHAVAPESQVSSERMDVGLYPWNESSRLAVFRLFIGVGLLLNLLFAIPAVFTPRVIERWMSFGVSIHPCWLQNVGLLLWIVCALYAAAIKDPFRYSYNAYLSIIGRFGAGVLFLVGVLFLDFPPGFRVLAAVDLSLPSIQLTLLQWLYRSYPGGSRR